MKAPNDLHPEDRAARIELRDILVERRQARGLSQSQLAALVGVSQSAIAHTETGQPWRIRPTQRIAFELGLRILYYPADLPGGPYDDPTMDVFRPTDLDRANQWDQDRLLSAMVSARRACGISQARLAAQLGLSENGLGNFERTTATGLMFATVQRYCRGLDGFLAIEVDELAVLEVAA